MAPLAGGGFAGRTAFWRTCFTAFQFAPPSHGAVFPFAAMSVAGTIFAAIFLADPLTKPKMLGIGIVMAGFLPPSGISAASLTRPPRTRALLFLAAPFPPARLAVLS